MSTTAATPGRFTSLPGEAALQATVVALGEHGFSVEVAGDLDAAREAVLARIPAGSSVMTHASVTLDQAGIADAINDGGGRWESARNQMFALDFATQAQQMKVSLRVHPWRPCRHCSGADRIRDPLWRKAFGTCPSYGGVAGTPGSASASCNQAGTSG